MIITGHVHHNIIEIDNSKINLPEGCLVRIIPVNDKKEVDDLCGCWEDKRSAEEIIKDIKGSRINRKKDFSL